MKYLAVIILIALFTLSGCQNSEAPIADPPDEPTIESTGHETVPPTGFSSNSDIAREEFTDEGKAIVYVGAFSSGSDGIRQAFEWLQTASKIFINPEYEIRIIDYGDMSVSDALYRLNLDILSGRPPDMLMTFGMPVEKYVSQDLLYDMNDWFDEADFFEGPFQAMKTGGKLYEISPGLSVTSLYGLSSNIGESDTITFSELFNAWERFKGVDKTFLTGFTNEQICSLLVSMSESLFVDKKTASCSFDSPEFIGLLEFCMKLPDERTITHIERDSSYLDILELAHANYLKRRVPEYIFPISVGEGESLLGLFSTARSKTDGRYENWHGYIPMFLNGAEVTYVGIPGICKAIVNMEFPLATMASSKNLTGVKLFIDATMKLSFAMFGQYDHKLIPLRLDVYHKDMQNWSETYKELMKFAGIDPDIIAESVLYYEGLKPYSKTEQMEFYNLVNNTQLAIRAPADPYGSDMTFNVDPIIADELKALFGGTQNARRTAELIQMRYSIYLEEQR